MNLELPPDLDFKYRLMPNIYQRIVIASDNSPLRIPVRSVMHLGWRGTEEGYSFWNLVYSVVEDPQELASFKRKLPNISEILTRLHKDFPVEMQELEPSLAPLLKECQC